MASESSVGSRREISYFDGINSAVSDNVAKITELWHGENVRSTQIGVLEKRSGYETLGSVLSSTANYGLVYFNTSTPRFYRVSTVGATTSLYYLDSNLIWTALTGGGTSLTATAMDFTQAENCLFMGNGTDANRYITSDGTTSVVATTWAVTNHLYNSPPAYKINFYKGRLYLGDYTLSGGTRQKNGIMWSSPLVGIVALVDGDATLPVASLAVTDTKYIYATDSLDVYRGKSKVGVLTVTAKTESTITATIAYEAGFSSVLSADELWVNGTKLGNKVFRWSGDGAVGIAVKEYDTARIEGSDFTEITMMENIGEYQMIASKNNLARWIDYGSGNMQVKNFDIGIGCSSPQGYVKGWGTLFFIHYGGIYATSGEEPKLISAKVQRYIDGASRTNIEATVASKHGFSVYFYIGDVTLYNEDGSTEKTLSDVVLEYYIKQNNWFVHTRIPMDYASSYVTQSSGIEYIAFSNPDTDKVYFYPFGNDDDDTDIFTNITTNDITLQKEFEKVSYPKEIIVEMPKGNELQVFASLDGGNFYGLEGTARKGCSIIKFTARSPQESPARCRKLKLSFREASMRSFKLSRVGIVDDLSDESQDYQN